MTAADAATTAGGQALTFRLGSEDYGIDILRVQEIKGYSAITPIPNTPVYLRGMMNLRGAVIPVIDLRLKFGATEAPCDRFTVVIVANVGTRTVGLVVDAVSDVIDLVADNTQPPPDLGHSIDTSYLVSVTRIGERLISLLNIEAIVGADVGVVAA